jgi:hypothetical protein
MMVFLFLLLAASASLAWLNHRRMAFYLLLITLVLASIWFSHHVTSHLHINL